MVTDTATETTGGRGGDGAAGRVMVLRGVAAGTSTRVSRRRQVEGTRVRQANRYHGSDTDGVGESSTRHDASMDQDCARTYVDKRYS